MIKTQDKPIINALLGKASKRYPVWFLRQAGRYLPEYQAIRAQMDFLTLCKNPEKAAEVTLQPLKRFDLDAAIIFSDILIPAVAMGQSLEFAKDHGPILSPTVKSLDDVKKLDSTDIANKCSYLGEALSIVKQNLKEQQTLIGFAGAPFTVASYMVEGGSSKNFHRLKLMAFQQEETLRALLEKISEASYQYLKMQVEAGAEVLMLFDSWASIFFFY